MLNDKFISLNDVFSDEDSCSMCTYGEFNEFDIPALCWEHYVSISEKTAELELAQDEAYFHLV